ncbi:MAG: hypothetical protein FWF15_00925 [Oscillospiraceae bacterium]|nr:hypothetical protein [Oscillospiraceae bacterium]
MKKRIIFAGMILALIFTLSLPVIAADPIFIYASEGKNNGMVLTGDAESYTGKYVSGFEDGTYIDYTFTITEPGDYIIWVRVWAAFDNSNSLLYHMNGKASANSVTFADNINTFDMYDALWGEQDVINPNRPAWDNFYNPDIHNGEDWYGVWYWMPICYRGVSDEISFYKYTTDLFTLGAGDHTLTIYTRILEPDARFDMFVVTNDLKYNPNDANGDPKSAWIAANPVIIEEPAAEVQEQAPTIRPIAAQTSDGILIFVLITIISLVGAVVLKKRKN